MNDLGASFAGMQTALTNFGDAVVQWHERYMDWYDEHRDHLEATMEPSEFAELDDASQRAEEARREMARTPTPNPADP